MAKPVWQQKLQAKLDANPLYHGKGDDPRCTCARCGGSGRRVTLRVCVNYGSTFNNCHKCGEVYR
jgi:predicted nucleic acid-binding Zn ribbon protein